MLLNKHFTHRRLLGIGYGFRHKVLTDSQEPTIILASLIRSWEVLALNRSNAVCLLALSSHNLDPEGPPGFTPGKSDNRNGPATLSNGYNGMYVGLYT
jgi:hypothetical protein